MQLPCELLGNESSKNTSMCAIDLVSVNVRISDNTSMRVLDLVSVNVRISDNTSMRVLDLVSVNVRISNNHFLLAGNFECHRQLLDHHIGKVFLE